MRKTATRRLALAAVLAAAQALPPGARALLSESDAGTAGGQFLRLGAGARESAMGEAGTAAAYTPAALHYNPAGIAYVTRTSLSLLYASHLAGTSYQHVSLAGRARRDLAFGASIRHFSAGELELRDSAGASTGRATPRDLAFTAGFARFLPRSGLGPLSGAAVGATLTWVRSSLSRSASTFTGGLGVRSRPFFQGRLRFGASGDNLFGSLEFDRQADPLPRALHLGVLATPWREWDLSLQVDLPSDGPPALAFGSEYALGRLALRAGYLGGGEASDDALSGLSGGFGVAFRRTVLDYALVPFGPLGQTHRFSVTLRF